MWKMLVLKVLSTVVLSTTSVVRNNNTTGDISPFISALDMTAEGIMVVDSLFRGYFFFIPSVHPLRFVPIVDRTSCDKKRASILQRHPGTINVLPSTLGKIRLNKTSRNY